MVICLSQLCASMDSSWSLMHVFGELAQSWTVLVVIVFGAGVIICKTILPIGKRAIS